MPISKSDFHHLKPPNWGKRISTCQFTQPARKGHARTVSRFTVISNVPDVDDAGTIRSYDPYNASRVLHPCGSQASHARIVIHRNGAESGTGPFPTSISHSYRSYKSAGGSFRSRPRTNSRRTATSSRLTSPHPSMSSIRSNHSTPRVRANNRSKRSVGFPSVRNKGNQHRRNRHTSLAAPASIAGDSETYDRDTLSPNSPHKEKKASQVPGTRSMVDVGEDSTFIWNEELEQLGHRIAQDCDEAFRSSLLLSEASEVGAESREASPFTLSLSNLPAMRLLEEPASGTGPRPWDNRPLPPVPSKSTLSPLSIRDHGPNADSTSHSAKTFKLHSALDPQVPERRVVSEPVYDRGRGARPLPSIYENTPDEKAKRNFGRHDMASSSLDTPTRVKNKGLDFLARAEHTIRVVNSPSAVGACGPVEIPQPLNVRKVSQNSSSTKQGLASTLRDPQRHASYDSHQKNQSVDGPNGDANIPAKKRVSSWFKRSSKEDASSSSFVTVTDTSIQTSTDSEPSRQKRPVSQPSDTSSMPLAHKKKSFGFPFWKGGKNEVKMSLGGK